MRERPDTVCDGGHTASEVFADRGALEASFRPDRLPERAIHRRTLAAAVGEQAGQTVAVVGRPGQGKTTTVGQVVEGAERAAVTLSCQDRSSVRSLAVAVHNELVEPSEALSRTGHSEANASEAARSALEDDDVLLVVDDAQQVAAEEVERFVRTVVTPETPLVLVADSLQFRNDLSRSFRTDGVDEIVVFGPYDEGELRQIVERRSVTAFRPDVVDPDALVRIAAIGAEAGGDAGRAIELLELAGEVAVERGAASITTEHVEQARQRREELDRQATIEALSPHERAVLMGMATLGRDGASPAAIDTVESAYHEAAARRTLEPNGRRSLRNYLDELLGADLVTRSEGRAGRFEYELSVDPSTLVELEP